MAHIELDQCKLHLSLLRLLSRSTSLTPAVIALESFIEQTYLPSLDPTSLLHLVHLSSILRLKRTDSKLMNALVDVEMPIVNDPVVLDWLWSHIESWNMISFVENTTWKYIFGITTSDSDSLVGHKLRTSALVSSHIGSVYGKYPDKACVMVLVCEYNAESDTERPGVGAYICSHCHLRRGGDIRISSSSECTSSFVTLHSSV
jgi:hypothetical protein